jgi:hypothetical protein
MMLPSGLMLSVMVLLTACGGGVASSTPPSSTTSTVPVPGVRSYLLEGANDVYLMQLRDGTPVQGIFEEVLGPAVTPDGQVQDWVYRVTGSVSGRDMTYHLVAISPGAPAFPPSMTGTITPAAVTLGEPFTSGSTDVLHKATQAEYNIAARAHVEAWLHKS